MAPLDKTVRAGGIAPTTAPEADSSSSKKVGKQRRALEIAPSQAVSLTAPTPSKLKDVIKSDGFNLAAGKPMKALKSVPVGLAIVNKTASQTMKTAAKAAGTDKAAGIVTAGRVMGGVGGGMKALALVQIGAELGETRRIAKEDRAQYELFKAMMDAYDPAEGVVRFDMGKAPEGLPEGDRVEALKSMATPAFLNAYAKGEGLSNERVILLKKALITTAEGTAGIATAAGAKWVPFLGTAVEGVKMVDGAIKVQGGITALNNLRGAAKNLDKTLEGVPESDAAKLKPLLEGLGSHVERERLIKGGRDLASAAVAGATFATGVALAVGTAGLGLAVANPALGIASAAVDIAMSVRDARHKAMLEELRDPERSVDAAEIYASGEPADYGAADNIGLTERTVLQLLANGTDAEKAAIRGYLKELGIPERRILAVLLQAETKPEDALKNLQEALYKDRVSSTQGMSLGLVGNSFRNMGRMVLNVFKGWRKEPRTPPRAAEEDAASLGSRRSEVGERSVAALIEDLGTSSPPARAARSSFVRAPQARPVEAVRQPSAFKGIRASLMPPVGKEEEDRRLETSRRNLARIFAEAEED